MKKTLLAVLLASAPFTTMAAASSAGHVDVYYSDANAEATTGGLSGDVDGDGFGIRGAAKFTDQAFVFGEYQNTEYDDAADLEIQQIRAGLGYLFSSSAELDLYGKVEFLNFEAEASGTGSSDDNGWGVHGGIAFMPAPEFRLFGELGYVDVGDSDGPEYNIGASYNFTPQFGAVVNYRVTDLDIDGGDELELSDLQVGVRFNF
ncbi:MAG TPA: outer membrane beta-barrel protein [Solimonas sp.]|nr:outer membrane beta-barrel protein [Solimonas sp.]